MSKYQKGDRLVIVTAVDKDNVGRVGTVMDISDDDHYTLDCLPNYAYKEAFVAPARGADLIREERRRQIEDEGYDARHDFCEPLNRLVAGAVSYAMADIDYGEAEAWWPWDFGSWKPKDRKRNLVRAGALIAAAIDKMQDEERFRKWKEETENQREYGV